MIPAISLKGALAGFRELGLNTADLLAATGLTPQQLADPFAAVPAAAFGQLWTAALTVCPDPTLPTRAGFAIPFSAFGLLDHLVAAASSVGEALLILNQLFWLVSSNARMEFSHGAHDWVWVTDDPSEPSRFITEQWRLAIIVQRFRGPRSHLRHRRGASGAIGPSAPRAVPGAVGGAGASGAAPERHATR
jgi:Arabinose-binding domain of AraC transcription regulator, N-term